MFEYQIDVFVVMCSDDLFECDDVGVSELFEKHDFAIGALCVSGVGEGVEIFFECFDYLGFFVCNFPDVPIGSTAYFLDDMIIFKYMWFYFFSHIDYTIMIITDYNRVN